MNILLVVFSENYLQKIMLPLWYVRITARNRGFKDIRDQQNRKTKCS